MKLKFLMVILILMGTLAGCNKPTPVAENLHNEPTLPANLNVLEYPFTDTAIFNSNLQPDQAAKLNGFPVIDTYHMEVTLADDLLSLSGRLQVRYFNRLEGDLAEVYFRLLPNMWGDLMQVSDVSVNGNPVETRLENSDTALYVPLPEKVPAGGYVDIDLSFSDVLPQDGSGNYGTFGFQDDTLALAQFYPLIPLRDEKGWRIEIYPPDGDVTVAESSNYLVQINIPDDLVVAASGIELLPSGVTGNRRVITQEATLAREFYLAASPEYVSQSLEKNGVTYKVYSHHEFSQMAGESLDYLASAVAIFDERYGEYPYRELELAATPTSAGGVEYPGVIALNQNLFDPAGSWSSMSSEDVIESVVVHEVAHQWFYNVVGDDQGREPWLDEAMAQYLTYQYFKDRYGANAASGFMQSWWTRWERVSQEDIPIGMPVESYSGREYGAIVYGRGPIFLYNLANEMGQAKFDKFLKDYFTTYSWKVATSRDFQSLAEATCSCDLDQLFNTWVYIE